MEQESFDLSAQLRRATRRAKSDVANKLVSMFLHSLSRKICEICQSKIEDDTYIEYVRKWFSDQCPYCLTNLTKDNVIVEHPDGMNRLRAGLHIPGNVVLACKPCNSEKRRDDSIRILVLAESGWESFLSHDGTKCNERCFTCAYWRRKYPENEKRISALHLARTRIGEFRANFPKFSRILPALKKNLPHYLAILYKDCQEFADSKIDSLMREFLEQNGLDTQTRIKELNRG
jgi:hypothetical protein